MEDKVSWHYSSPTLEELSYALAELTDENKFISSLVKFAKDDPIILIVGDLGYGVIEPFVDEFPDRFFNAGVARANMVRLGGWISFREHETFCLFNCKFSYIQMC